MKKLFHRVDLDRGAGKKHEVIHRLNTRQGCETKMQQSGKKVSIKHFDSVQQIAKKHYMLRKFRAKPLQVAVGVEPNGESKRCCGWRKPIPEISWSIDDYDRG